MKLGKLYSSRKGELPDQSRRSMTHACLGRKREGCCIGAKSVGELEAECWDLRTRMLQEGPLAVGTTGRMCNSWGRSGMESVREGEEGGQREKGERSWLRSRPDSSLSFPTSLAMTIKARHLCVSASDGKTWKGQSFISTLCRTD